MTLHDLAARCESATGPDRELDRDIANAVGVGSFFASGNEAFAFTTSIDAALTLVPDGWTFANLSQGDRGNWWCELRKGFLTSYSSVAIGTQLNSTTPAFALCAAALRARAQIEGGTDDPE